MKNKRINQRNRSLTRAVLKKLVITGAFALSVLLCGHAAAAGRGNSAGNGGNSDSGGALSSKPLVITAAEPNLETDALIISGQDLGDSQFAGQAFLWNPTQGFIELTLLAYDPAKQELAATLPAGMSSYPGSFLLHVVNGNSPHRADTFSMTIGAVGPQGPEGPQGIQGPVGPSGPQGVQGVAGPTGPVGPMGPVGPQGQPGIQGVVGPVGPQGDVGLVWRGPWSLIEAYDSSHAVQFGGSAWIAKRANVATVPVEGDDWSLLAQKGDEGIQGPQGVQGVTGPQGPVGPIGATGLQGPIGLTGPIGPQGVQGPVGPTGPVGPEGAQGPQGLPGMTWEGAWSSTTTYAAHDVVAHAGSAWIALQENTDSAPGVGGDWFLVAMKGDQGEVGATGPQGPVGPQGPIGFTGPVGPMGPQGVSGPQGPDGPQGLVGPEGPQGLIGPSTTDDNTHYVGADQNNDEADSTIALGVDGAPVLTVGDKGRVAIGRELGSTFHVKQTDDQTGIFKLERADDEMVVQIDKIGRIGWGKLKASHSFNIQGRSENDSTHFRVASLQDTTLFGVEPSGDANVAGNVNAAGFVGSGAGLTDLPVANLSGSITSGQLAPEIGVWTTSGADVSRASGKVGVGIVPGSTMHVRQSAGSGIMKLEKSDGSTVLQVDVAGRVGFGKLKAFNSFNIQGLDPTDANHFRVASPQDTTLFGVQPDGDATVSGTLTADRLEGSLDAANLTGTIDASRIASGSIGGGKLANGSVDSATIANQSIATEDIAGSAITSGKIASGAIGSGKIADGAVGTMAIADLAITRAKIADQAVDSGQLAADAINTSKIKDGAVTTSKIADGAVDSPQIAAGSIGSGKIKEDAIVTVHLADNAVNNDKIANNAIQTAQIAPGAVGTTDLANGAVSTDKLAALAVTAAKLANLSVDSSKLATDSVTSAKIANGAVDTSEIQVGAVTAAKLAANSVSNAKLADNAVTSAEIADGTITADDIAPGVIPAGSWTVSGNDVYRGVGKVGIGDTTPNANLHVLQTGTGTDPFRVDDTTGSFLFKVTKGGSMGYRKTYSNVGFTVRARTDDVHSLIVENNGGGGAFSVDTGGRIGVREAKSDVTFNIKARSDDNNWLRVEKPATTESIFRVRSNGAHVDLGDMTIHNGDLYISIGSFFNTSDRRLKNDIAEMDGTLNKVMELRPSTYRYNEEGDNARKRIGMIAQEVAEVYPELVTEKDGFLRLDYTSFGVIAIQAIQEQQAQIKQKDEKVKSLEARLARLEALMHQSGKLAD